MENVGLNKESIDKIIRDFENTKYFGYIFFVKYDGSKFDSFDENPNCKSVKLEFRKLLEKNEINIYKGIQQGGRTDKDVNALENILYINSKNNINFNKLKYKKIEGLEILNIKKTIPFLEIPEMIENRYYLYEYPVDLIKNNEETINKKCIELSGEKNYKKYTSKKGEKLKNHIRNIEIKYENGKLYFKGDSFLPQQVRIMSNVILNNKLSPLDGKYLTLEKIKMGEKLENFIFENVENIDEIDKNIKEKINKIEKNKYFYIFYVNKKNKSEIIGKKGKNIRELKKIFGNIIVKEWI